MQTRNYKYGKWRMCKIPVSIVKSAAGTYPILGLQERNEKKEREEKKMLLTIEGLQVRYGKQTALKITSPVAFEKGERIGVIGSNGAGKSTLVKALLGLLPYEGRIVTNLTPEQMAVHMQFNEYVTTMSVKCIMEAILNTKIKADKELQELIAFFDFESCLSQKYNALSGGQKQKFTIIMVMMQKAELTFYDEVTSGLDFETRQKLTEKMVSWYRDKKDTLLVVSHYYDELEQLADKILVLDQGKVVAYGNKEELFKTYCGRVIFIMDNRQRNRELMQTFQTLRAPEHLLAIAGRNKKEEEKIVSILIENDINFKRSNSDIEIMFMNAKENFYRQQEDKIENEK